ncbi:GNAT family N-acetyltransferase [Microbacterium sp. Kw_RZR3]|uniref:GNAT family N-acetyltransferase n=1 Tax=unclassified Microbacterium TaxID=2609290 RepID=UPI0023DC63DC|nr:GNAT family N-acetyltransferase [Microbacterium sp. Kw_RZR3]MDF2046805.1 GNAT family N-acetyltransferase [Microbacterium sp. Kw_RZR3]
MPENYPAEKRAEPIDDRTVMIHRHLDYEEAKVVVELIKDETTITGYSVEEWMSTRDVVVCADSTTGALIGVALVHHLLPGWSEIAVVLVLPEWRGHGVGARLVKYVAEHIEHLRRKAILFYCQGSMERIVLRLGFDTYADEAAFAEKSWPRKVFIKALYPLQWRAESYRRQEIRRKATSLQCDFQFKIAVLAHVRGIEN